MIESERDETKELNEKANKVEKCEEAASIIKEYGDIIRTKKMICISYLPGKVFRRFKEKEKFISMFSTSKVTKSKMMFKINIVKLIYQFSKLMESLTLIFFKNYFIDTKDICTESSTEFI